MGKRKWGVGKLVTHGRDGLKTVKTFRPRIRKQQNQFKTGIKRGKIDPERMPTGQVQSRGDRVGD